MDIKTVKIIENLGLESKEARAYLAALELGGASVLEIAKKANIERVNTYYVLESLEQKGLVYESKRGKGRKFYAIGPDKFIEQVQEKVSDFHGILPDLRAIENRKENKPKIRYFEGIEGIKQAYADTLRIDAKNEEILSVATAVGVYSYLGDWIGKYLEKRIQKGIHIRAIIEDSDEARTHKDNDREELRVTKLVPKEKFPFKNEINIYGNKVMIASYADLMAAVIESQDVAETQRAFFELAWEGAERYAQ